MKRILCLRFPNWPLQHLLISGRVECQAAAALYLTPESAAADTHPSAATDHKYLHRLFRATRSGPAVVAVNASAWTQGVRPGMPLAEARSMAGTDQGAVAVEFYPWASGEDRMALTALAEEVRCFAPRIGLDELPLSDSLLLDITGCGPLFGGESALAEVLTARLKTMGFRTRVAISESVAAAWAFAHVDTSSSARQPRARRLARVDAVAEWRLPVIIIPPGQAIEHLQALPLSSGRLAPDDTDLLQQLGITTLKRALELPLDDLPSRLSTDAVMRIRQMLGDQEEFITPLPEADPVQADWASESPAQNHSAICQVLDHLCGRVAEQLRQRLMGATRVDCQLALEDGQTVQLSAEFVRPVQSAEVMRDMLQLRLDRTSVPGSVPSIRMQAGLSPMPVARQRDLFSHTEHVRPQDELATLVNRMSNRLGREAALQARMTVDPRPEFTAQLTPVMAQDDAVLQNSLRDLVMPDSAFDPWQPEFDRPIRLLIEPRPLPELAELRTGGELLLPDHRCQITQILGPERLQTAWWQDAATHRDYYVVQTSDAARFWLFQELRTGEWFLHGIFD